MKGVRALRFACLAAALVMCGPALAADEGWITDGTVASSSAQPVVLHFRRAFDVKQIPKTMPVTVTADNRFVLFVNGVRAASGPSAGTLAHWRTEAVDLAPYLHGGSNVIAAVVWDFVRTSPQAATGGPLPAASALPPQVAPIAQQSAGLGFRLTGGSLSTAMPGWRVKRDEGHSAINGRAQVPRGLYYVASAPEVIDAAKADWDWAGPAETGTGWHDAVPAAGARHLIADPLPQQSFSPAPPGAVVRSDLAGAEVFPVRAVTVPANSHVHILLRRDAMISGYPELDVSGGGGTTIKLTYAEALYDADNKKADRDAVGDRRALGIFDTFIADGARRTFTPLWWRTWRYTELDIQTSAAPLTLEALRVYETGYPFKQVGHFASSDPVLNRIWNVGWRTAQIDAHETYMDSAYWEQLQYTGDTRLQMLISYGVSGDPRLAAQAIDAFAQSDAEGGLEQGAYPSRSDNVIATFSLAWVGMLSDWSMEQPDKSVIVRNLPRMRTVLKWFEPWRTASDLLSRNPQWNFIDWVGKNDREVFPSYGKDGGSCLTTVLWLGALRQGAALETAYGDKQQAAADTANADAARAAIRAHCWDAGRGLFADNSDFSMFSQHMNALAVLYDVATREEAPAILDRITVPGHGIDAPDGMATTTYYFSWYLVRAFEHAGLASRYPGLLKNWRDLLELHFTTWPEKRGDTRSDTHAWSAHPTADLLGVIAGIRPAAPGYARLRVAPVLGDLTALDATAATPKGAVSVRYQIAGGKLIADITRPDALPGDFVWNGEHHALKAVHSHFVLPKASP
jgi:alpha-L-rhamnosidase